jgi:hypothetical protein
VQNPWILQLLKWHGHDKGGVRVPFQEGTGNPLGSPIETALLARLRNAARSIATGAEGPRVIFLVGGPGNGKSEAVQVFLEELGEALGCRDELKVELQKRFKPCPVSPSIVRLVDTGRDPALAPLWSAAGQLTIIQDASASEEHSSDASETLVSTIEDILGAPNPGVIICCLNRGLLARAVDTASDRGDENALYLLDAIASRTGLGLDALNPTGRECWPMTGLEGIEIEIGAWPLDLESLAEPGTEGPSSLEQVICTAVDTEHWTEGCYACPARESSCCPFYQNASDLRDADQRQSLLKVLRNGEIATGQRWNFRDSFSLVAGLIVGEQDNFTEDGNNIHPCNWVQSRASSLTLPRDGDLDIEVWTCAMRSTFELASRLYPHALFSPIESVDPSVSFLVEVSDWNEKTRRTWELLANQESRASSFIENYLADVLTPILSPELWAPGGGLDEEGGIDAARKVEDSFSQAVELGIDQTLTLAGGKFTKIELYYLECLQQAEAEWDPLARGSSAAGDALRSIRKLASAFSKRSLGARQGWHAKQAIIDEYIASIRSIAKLGKLRNELENMLGRGNFEVDAIGGFGQLDSNVSKIVLRSSETPRIKIERAPSSDPQRPAHDMPSIVLDGMPPLPLTFALFEALSMRRGGCRIGSLPPVLATVLGKLRQLHASGLGKKVDNFVERRTSYVLGNLGELVASDDEVPAPLLDSEAVNT